MLTFNNYLRAKSLEEAYELYQKKSNIVLGGMLWLKMQNKTCQTAIDLCDLGLNRIEENDEEFRIGAYVTLHDLETNEALNAYTKGAMAEAVKHIVGVQFRNVATLGGSIWGRYGFSDVMTIFMAFGAEVELFKGGIMPITEFAKMDRKTRDILVGIRIPKKAKKVVYLSQRNQSTDFPVLTCAVAVREDGCYAVVGAAPYLAREVKLDIDPAAIDAAAAGQYVSEAIAFGSNVRAGADYRKIICKVLVRRALEQLQNMEGEER